MSDAWPAVDYSGWSDTCDTLHAHTQVLGKVAAALAPPEPEFEHTALRITARGWETHPLPAPDGSGAVVLGLDLRSHEAFIEHNDARVLRTPLTPNRAVGEVTRDVLDGFRTLAGPVEINPTPQEVWWSVPLDEDREHATYDPEAVARYLYQNRLPSLKGKRILELDSGKMTADTGIQGEMEKRRLAEQPAGQSQAG